MKPASIHERIDALAWQDLEAQLDSRGYAVTPSLLSEGECVELATLYEQASLFRKTIDMARHGFGEGEYRYFAEPIPEPVASLRESA